ncbi:MAG: aminotransferase class V-fold PLP-dependent enzyme [Peptococcaceae bacterium]|jgi:selenocysteine lyase/cysteine desulfurase|nr:aminotransferase class V-fold PLP-dependent enzyme [Peptococcaceae bacterium]
MIYFDNSATTLMKPPGVAEAVAYAVSHFGNAGRSFYDPVLLANREIYSTRMEIAKLAGLDDPLRVAFTSSSTESLNLVIGGLVERGDAVITTVTEHNSVLRPLYLKGCDLSFIDCDDHGVLRADTLEEMLKPPAGRPARPANPAGQDASHRAGRSARFLICTHGSNVTGNVTDVRKFYDVCKANRVKMILDVSQTFGVVPVHVDMADILCFTGHKGLFGPQGTGGVIANGAFDFNIVKTGGAGVRSFDRFQPRDMPDIFETGTLNSHGIYGLQKGVRFINETGIDAIHAKEARLLKMFHGGVKDLEGVKIYGDFSEENRLPVLSLNIAGLTSSELAERLWSGYGVATRAGSHCAPLLHKRLGTVDVGMVRFSFSYFNTEDEVQKGVSAMEDIVQSLRQVKKGR